MTLWLPFYCYFTILVVFTAGSLDPFSQDCLDAHNNYRAKHGVPPLMWSHDLAEGAQNWADQLASTDSLQHDQVAIQNRKIGKEKHKSSELSTAKTCSSTGWSWQFSKRTRNTTVYQHVYHVVHSFLEAFLHKDFKPTINEGLKASIELD